MCPIPHFTKLVCVLRLLASLCRVVHFPLDTLFEFIFLDNRNLTETEVTKAFASLKKLGSPSSEGGLDAYQLSDKCSKGCSLGRSGRTQIH